MVSPLYAVMGASGNVGKVVARALLDSGRRVRVIGRDASRLQEHLQKGAEVALGNVEDAAFLTQAFQGAKAAFVMVPANYTKDNNRSYQNQVTEAAARAVKANGITHVVTLSSVGAELGHSAGPVNGLHDLEKRFDSLGVNVLHLRAAYFMENFLNNVGMIKGMGIHGTPARADLNMTFVATKDIGEVAARRLAALDFAGSSFLDLMGPRDMTMAEVTRIIGKAIGKPELAYVHFPYEEARKAMLGKGLHQETVNIFLELYRGLNEGVVRHRQPRSPSTTTTTTFEEFVKTTFVPAYQQA